MATATSLSGAHPEHRGLSFWMDRVLKELANIGTTADPEAVHDLRVAIRRCRSVASVMEEVDPDSVWPEIRKSAKKLFRALGTLRDAQVMEEWVKKLGPDGDPVRAQLQSTFESQEKELKEHALRAASKFDEKNWRHLERRSRHHARLVPIGSLAAECMALERLETAKDLHSKALRTDKTKPWHALRIGLKRFRYTVENFLPEHYASWETNLKRVQDLLGDLHDLDVLLEQVRDSDSVETEDSRKFWEEAIQQERRARIETYRQLTLGKTSLWNEWRSSLPTNGRLEAASLARLRVTARALDPHTRKTSQVSRIAVAIFDALRNAKAGDAFTETRIRLVFLAAAKLHSISGSKGEKTSPKAARKLVRRLTMPPGWSTEEWNLLGWTVRYHRGAEPKSKSGAFSDLSEKEQQTVRALAGVLRLARGLRKSGVTTGTGFRVEPSANTLVLRAPAFDDSPETAARLGGAKHLLDFYLGKPIVLQPRPSTTNLVALPAANHPVLQAASD